MTVKKTEDIINDLLKFINPLLMMLTHFDLLKLFVVDCQYDGLKIDETLDYINDFYDLYIQTDDITKKHKIQEQCSKIGINPIYLSEFMITYSNELNTMVQQTPEENKDYLMALQEEMENPTELIQNVKEYARNL